MSHASASRDDLLLEVRKLAWAGERHDLVAVRHHHDRIVALVDVLLPARRRCDECEVGGGRHADFCSQAMTRPKTTYWWQR